MPTYPSATQSETLTAEERSDAPLADETLIAPLTGWPAVGLRDLWKYRDLLFQLTLRNIKVRYKQTILGVLWAVLQPLLFVAVFAFALGRWVPAAPGGVPYPLFVFSGLLPWIFFQSALLGAANSVVGSEGLITKVYFPRLAIPLSHVASALLDLGIAFAALVAMSLWYGIVPSSQMLLLPLAVALLLAAATGMGTLLAALTVSYRDFRHVVPVVLQAWMLATPTIFFPPSAVPANASTQTAAAAIQAREPEQARPEAARTASSLPERAGRLTRLNPMTVPIDFFRASTLGRPLAWGSVAISVAVNVAICLIGLLYFRRVEDVFADVI